MVKVLLDKLFLTSSGGNFLHGVFISQGDIDKALLKGLENYYDVDLIKILTEEK